ncbi:MAG: hypothetical protein ACOY5F_16275 [Pseudomonadota bacterium]|jgi:hypothetical protein
MTTRLAFTGALTAVMLGGMLAPAAAQRVTDTAVSSCVFSGGAVHCAEKYRYGDRGNNGIQSLKEPDPVDLSDSRDRESRWVARCKPQLRSDRYGVNRYVYAAPGCEYGRDRD